MVQRNLNTLSIEQAKLEGFTVDTTVYPHVGYKGGRFRPDETCDVLTELEADLIELNLTLLPVIQSVLTQMREERTLMLLDKFANLLGAKDNG